MEYIQKRQTSCDICGVYCGGLKKVLSKKLQFLSSIITDGHRVSDIGGPAGPPTSETRWPFGKSGGQWPPGHREFRALYNNIYIMFYVWFN